VLQGLLRRQRAHAVLVFTDYDSRKHSRGVHCQPRPLAPWLVVQLIVGVHRLRIVTRAAARRHPAAARRAARAARAARRASKEVSQHLSAELVLIYMLSSHPCTFRHERPRTLSSTNSFIVFMSFYFIFISFLFHFYFTPFVQQTYLTTAQQRCLLV
jgi:hypothetical protein